MTTRSDDSGNAVAYHYDANGMLAALIDDNGNKTVWTYDCRNLKKAEAKGYTVAPALRIGSSGTARYTSMDYAGARRSKLVYPNS